MLLIIKWSSFLERSGVDVRPGVCDDHDNQGDEVDGGEKEEGEGFDGVRVRPEGDALLVLGGIGVGVCAPSK